MQSHVWGANLSRSPFWAKLHASAKGYQLPLHSARFNDICAPPGGVCAQRINCWCCRCCECIICAREKVSHHFLCLLLLCFASWKAISSDCASRDSYSHSHTPNPLADGENAVECRGGALLESSVHKQV
jgi:hypothetical protein